MTFTRKGVYINPSRVSPAIISVHPTKPGSTSRRLNVVKNELNSTHDKVAICVTPGMCNYSHIMTTAETRGARPMRYKYVDFLLHDQDWERWEAFMCFCLGEPQLHSNITDLCVQMTTMKVLSSNSQDTNPRTLIVFPPLLLELTGILLDPESNNSPMRSQIRRSTNSQPTPSGSNVQYQTKYALMPDDTSM